MKTRICFFTTHYDFPRQRMMEYYEKIFPKNVEIFLFCQKDEAEKFQLKRSQKHGYSSDRINVAWELRAFCKENGVNILTNLARRTKVALMMIAATLFTDTKIVFYDHGNPKPGALISFAFLQFFLDKYLIGTTDLAEKVRHYLWFSKRKIGVLPTAIDTEAFKPTNKMSIRNKLKIGKNEKVIGFVGRIEYMKGSDIILEIIKQNPDKRFLLLGRLMDENYDLKKLKNVIQLLANYKDVPKYDSTMDLQLFMSRSEGLGLAYREAMSCGVPAIISDIEALRTVKAAIKVPFDVKKIQEKIDWFFNLSQKERNSLSKRTRESMIKEYSEKALAKPHINAFLRFD